MKTNFKFFTILSLIVLLNISCDSYIDGLNTDPNTIKESDSKHMFEGVLLGSQFWQNSNNTRIAMLWMNQATGSDRQYQSLNDWNSSSASDFTGDWKTMYVNTMANAKIVETKAITEGAPHTAGAAKVIRAYTLGMAASLWGDVPATEALDFTNFPNPHYDSQVNVYAMAQNLLDEAIVLLSTTSGVSIEFDLAYGGDVNKWIKLAHSTKARFYLHTKDYPNANNEAVLGMASPSDDYIAVFGTSYLKDFNPFYSFLVYDRDGYMSADDAYAAKLLDASSGISRNNARTNEILRYNFNYQTTGWWHAGYDLNFLQAAWYGGQGKFCDSSDMPLMTYGEMLLIQAEYQARTNGVSAGVTAYNRYRNLLRTGYSIGTNNDGYADLFGGTNHAGDPGVYDNYLDADFAAGGIENLDNIAAQDALLREIYEERYVYFIGSLEAFTDFRRTNNLAEIQLKSGFSGTPQRFIYPQIEIDSNSSTPSPAHGVTDKTAVNM